MKNKSNYNRSLKLIMQIQNIRKKNNVNWMDILRIAFKHDPKKTAKVMAKIYADDQKISRIVKELL